MSVSRLDTMDSHDHLLSDMGKIESFSFKLRINVSCMCHECIGNVS